HKPGYFGFEVIGIMKLISGLIAVVMGIGLVRFLGHDPGPRAERVISHLGLDPQNHIIHELISRISGVDKTQLRAIEAGTFGYALLHLIEGIGLILRRNWAGYLVIFATASLIPFEIYEVARKPGLLRVGILAVNAAILLYLIVTMKKLHTMHVRAE